MRAACIKVALAVAALLLAAGGAQAQDRVCPNNMTAQQALAAGCRFMGSYGGYDLCANPGSEHYPQCAAMYTPHNAQPSQYQVWVGVIMPTQNCENYDASHNGHYDCSVWCRAFLHDNSTPVSRPQLPAICDKYLGQRPTQTCSAADPQACCDAQAALPPAPVGGPPAAIVNMVELWKQRVDTYWEQEFLSVLHRAYTPPMLEQSGTWGILQYWRPTRTIQYNVPTVNAILTHTGNFGLVVAIAHEEGHSVQFLLGSTLEGMPRELQADRYAGAFLRWADQNHFLRQCDLAAALTAIFRAGDTLPAFMRRHHGTPHQRLAAILNGYNNGPDLSIPNPNPLIKPNPFPSPSLIPGTN
jgi:hypothetical protein